MSVSAQEIANLSERFPEVAALSGVDVSEEIIEQLVQIDKSSSSALARLGLYKELIGTDLVLADTCRPASETSTATERILNQLDSQLVEQARKLDSEAINFPHLLRHPYGELTDGHTPRTQLSTAMEIVLARRRGTLLMNSRQIKNEGLENAVIAATVICNLSDNLAEGAIRYDDLTMAYEPIIEQEKKANNQRTPNTIALSSQKQDDTIAEYKQLDLTVNDLRQSVIPVTILLIAQYTSLMRSLPKEPLEQAAEDKSIELSAEDLRDMLTARGIQYFGLKNQISESINGVLELAINTTREQDLTPELAAYFQRGAEIAGMLEYVGTVQSALENIKDIARERATYKLDLLALDAEEQSRRAWSHINAIQRESIAHLNGASPEYILGALATETAVAAIMKHYNPDIILPKSGLWGRAHYLHNVINRIEQDQLSQLNEQRCSQLLEQVDTTESKLTTSGTQLRKMEGLQTRRLVQEITDNGQNSALFMEPEARNLAGMILKTAGNKKSLDQILQDIAELKALWAELATLSNAPSRRGIIRTIDTLGEWRESIDVKQQRKLENAGLKGLLDFADAIASFQPENAQDTPDDSTSNESVEDDEESEKPRSAWKIAEEFSDIEFVKAFPPGTTAEEIKEELVRASVKYDRDPIEWARIDSLIDLKNEFEREGLEVVTHRLMQTTWHPLPHYVIEVKGPNTIVAVIESPIYGNATYIIADNDWRTIVEDTKEEVRNYWHGIAKVHAPHISLGEHRQKLLNTVHANY